MKNKLQLTEAVFLPSSTLPATLSQIGDKNTAVHHADNVTINNYIQTGSLPPPDCSAISGDGCLALPKGTDTLPDFANKTEDREISHDYYNLFVISDEIKNWRFTMPKDRSLRSNSDKVKKFADLTPEAIAQIKTFPSLFMNENTQYGGRTSPEQEAYYGFVTDLRVQENGIIKVRFCCDAKINQQQINNIVRMLDIYEGSGIMELNHTHWTIKNVDLIEELTEAELLPKEYAGGGMPMNMYHAEPRSFSQTGARNTLIAHADLVVMHGAASTAEEFYRDILIYLESKRVLYNPGEVEQREHCIQSVLDMKDTLSKSVMGKRLSTNELQPIRKMASACVDYLNKVGKPAGQVFVITAQSGCDWFDNSPNGSLGKLRGSFRSVIKELENEYKIHYRKDIC